MTELDNAVGDMAIGVSLTHDTQEGVKLYLKENGLKVGRNIHAHIEKRPGQHSVECSRHAFELATALAQMIRDQRSQCAGNVNATIHLFISAPNGFTFFLGQMQNGLGKVQLYEFGFGRSARYMASLGLPLSG